MKKGAIIIFMDEMNLIKDLLNKTKIFFFEKLIRKKNSKIAKIFNIKLYGVVRVYGHSTNTVADQNRKITALETF